MGKSKTKNSGKLNTKAAYLDVLEGQPVVLDRFWNIYSSKTKQPGKKMVPITIIEGRIGVDFKITPLPKGRP